MPLGLCVCALQEGYDFFQRWTAEPNFPRYLVLQVSRTTVSELGPRTAYDSPATHVLMAFPIL